MGPEVAVEAGGGRPGDQERLCGRDASDGAHARGVRDGWLARGTGRRFCLGRKHFGFVRPFLVENWPMAIQTAVLGFFFFTTLPGIFLFAFYQSFKTLLTPQVKWVLASRGGAMEIHYVGWRGLVDIVHLETTEITAIHQTTHPSWAGPPTDAYIIAGWKIFRAPLHDDASRLCEVLGIDLDRTEPNLADLYVKQGDMSGNRPRGVSGDAEFEGYRDRQRPFGMWFLSVFMWAFLSFSLFSCCQLYR